MSAEADWDQAGRIARLEIARLQRLSSGTVVELPRITLSRAQLERLIERLQRHISESGK